jgi:hypothetical protein
MNIVNLALSFGGWVYGGYVRDVLILKLDQFNDIDIAIPESADVETLLRCYGCLSNRMSVRQVDNFSYGGKNLIKIDLDGVKIDLVIVSSFEDWRAEHSTDLTCNLFYKSSTCHLGIRYIPEDYKVSPDPVGDLLALTKRKKFVVIQPNHTAKLEKRITSRLLNGWVEQI